MGASLSEFKRFCIVGLVAFLADAATVFVLTHSLMQDSYARIFSLMVGMHVAYVLNSRYTYRQHRGICFATWRAFVASNLVGSCINYCVFLAALAPLTSLLPASFARIFAIAVGTGVALIFNYWANRRFAFRKETP